MQKNAITDEDNRDINGQLWTMLIDKIGVSFIVAANTALYAGLDKSEFNRIAPAATAENRISLINYSMTGAVFFAVLAMACTLNGVFAAVNLPCYAVCCVIMLLMFFAVRRIRPERTRVVRLMTYVFMTVLYALSIVLTLLHTGMLSVMFIVMLVALPLLFYDRPIIMACITVIVTLAFCLLVSIYKPADIAAVDRWNVITFAALALVIEMTVGRLRYRALAQEDRIGFMSTYDLLTGLKNRNCYEMDLENYPDRCEKTLICIYADANGLHEINKKKGHKAGDLMLKYIAAHMQSRFGYDTYRIGGDEFVVLIRDEDPDKVKADIEKLGSIFRRRGYAVSFGFAEAAAPDISMDTLTEKAEHEMYTAKDRYYEETDAEPR